MKLSLFSTLCDGRLWEHLAYGPRSNRVVWLQGKKDTQNSQESWLEIGFETGTIEYQKKKTQKFEISLRAAEW